MQYHRKTSDISILKEVDPAYINSSRIFEITII